MPALGTTTPILRIFDIAKAHEFYVDFLGFEVQWEHRFEDIAALHRELIAKAYRFAKPGLHATPWQTREISVTDPFGNRLHFFEEMPGYERRPKPGSVKVA